jgi:hypothetical protein
MLVGFVPVLKVTNKLSRFESRPRHRLFWGFCGFLRSRQANSVIMQSSKTGRFIPNNLQFVYHPIIWRCMDQFLSASLNSPQNMKMIVLYEEHAFVLSTYWAGWCSSNTEKIYSGFAQLIARTSAILSDVSLGSLHTVYENTGRLSRVCHGRFLPDSSVHYPLIASPPFNAMKSGILTEWKKSKKQIPGP